MKKRKHSGRFKRWLGPILMIAALVLWGIVTRLWPYVWPVILAILISMFLVEELRVKNKQIPVIHKVYAQIIDIQVTEINTHR